jgi:hypothetical protein
MRRTRLDKALSIATVCCLFVFAIASKAGVNGFAIWVLLSVAAVVIAANVAVLAYEARRLMAKSKGRGD